MYDRDDYYRQTGVIRETVTLYKKVEAAKLVLMDQVVTFWGFDPGDYVVAI